MLYILKKILGIVMTYELKSDILGFSNVTHMEFSKLDEHFATLRNANEEKPTFTLANPYPLREYSFDIPTPIKVLLDIKEDSKLLVYCIMVVQEPLDESRINFLAPIIFNNDNNTMAQIVFDLRDYPDFGVAEPLKNFKK